MSRLVALILCCPMLAGCTAAYDNDGEGTAIPVVVDTDLSGDDLLALAFLLRHPRVSVEAVTIAATGMVGCDPGVDLVADLFTALQEEPVPVACGRAEPGQGGIQPPQGWEDYAQTGSGLPRSAGTMSAAREGATELTGDLAERMDGLVVVALGPLTNPADLAAADPDAYGRLARVHVSGGSVDGEAIDGVAEWNAAADPEAFAAVLAGPVPVTVVPVDAVPPGTPDRLQRAPILGRIAASGPPKLCDLAAAAVLVAPESAVFEAGTWMLDNEAPGQLRREGDGSVRVVTLLDPIELGPEFKLAFAAIAAA